MTRLKLINLPYMLIIAAALSLIAYSIVALVSNSPGQVGLLLSSALFLCFFTVIIYLAFHNALLTLLRFNPIIYIFAVWLLLVIIFTLPTYMMLGMNWTRCFFFVANALTTTAIPLTGSWRFHTIAFIMWYDTMQWLG